MTLCRTPRNEAQFAAAKKEAEQRLPEFQRAWAKHGPLWLKETAKLVGHPFEFNEALGTLMVCQDHPWGRSYPLTMRCLLIQVGSIARLPSGRGGSAKVPAAAGPPTETAVAYPRVLTTGGL